MGFPSWLQWYKKPEFRDIKEYAAAAAESKRPFSPIKQGKSSIPNRLSLERILQNKTCSPMSLYDFYMYLKHVEYSAENLEFYVWYKNYEKSYAKSCEKSGRPDIVTLKDEESWNSSAAELSPSKSEDTLAEKPMVAEQPMTFDIDSEIDSEIGKETMNRIFAFLSPASRCSVAPGIVCGLMPKAIPDIPGTDAGQRAQLNTVIQLFLVPGAPKELNIPQSLRDQAHAGLKTSSDPIHLEPIASHIYQLLQNCSHRNFVRLGVGNGTVETICVATSLGIVMTLAGFLFVFLRAFYPFRGFHTRWDAIAAWPLWWIGLSFILSGIRGSCFFLLLFSRRQPLPWERLDDDSTDSKSQPSGVMKVVSRLMIMDRKIKVQDTHLRNLQRKIVVQSLVGGAIFATVCVLLFIFLPTWRETVMLS